MRRHIVPVIGTTGLTADELDEIGRLADQTGTGAMVIPNFAIGAVLMMKFAAEAAKYMPNVEIIELHHDKKTDAPSGTSIKTAEMIDEARGDTGSIGRSRLGAMIRPGERSAVGCRFTACACRGWSRTRK